MLNVFIESFDGSLRDELRSEMLLSSFAHARTTLWHTDYSTARPNSQLGWNTPAEFSATL